MEVLHQGTGALGRPLAGHDTHDQPVIRVQGHVVPMVPLVGIGGLGGVAVRLLLDSATVLAAR